MLLEETDDEANYQARHHTHGRNHYSLDSEDAAHRLPLHTHGTKGGNVMPFVHHQEREGCHKVEGGDEDDKGKDEIDAI